MALAARSVRYPRPTANAGERTVATALTETKIRSPGQRGSVPGVPRGRGPFRGRDPQAEESVDRQSRKVPRRTRY